MEKLSVEVLEGKVFGRVMLTGSIILQSLCYPKLTSLDGYCLIFDRYEVLIFNSYMVSIKF